MPAAWQPRIEPTGSRRARNPSRLAESYGGDRYSIATRPAGAPWGVRRDDLEGSGRVHTCRSGVSAGDGRASGCSPRSTVFCAWSRPSATTPSAWRGDTRDPACSRCDAGARSCAAITGLAVDDGRRDRDLNQPALRRPDDGGSPAVMRQGPSLRQGSLRRPQAEAVPSRRTRAPPLHGLRSPPCLSRPSRPTVEVGPCHRPSTR